MEHRAILDPDFEHRRAAQHRVLRRRVLEKMGDDRDLFHRRRDDPVAADGASAEGSDVLRDCIRICDGRGLHVDPADGCRAVWGEYAGARDGDHSAGKYDRTDLDTAGCLHHARALWQLRYAHGVGVRPGDPGGYRDCDPASAYAVCGTSRVCGGGNECAGLATNVRTKWATS